MEPELILNGQKLVADSEKEEVGEEEAHLDIETDVVEEETEEGEVGAEAEKEYEAGPETDLEAHVILDEDQTVEVEALTIDEAVVHLADSTEAHVREALQSVADPQPEVKIAKEAHAKHENALLAKVVKEAHVIRAHVIKNVPVICPVAL